MSYFLSDRYETQDVLYETSHTRVVLVRALDTGDLHVIKGIRKDPTTPEHFFLEASLLQDLSHPGIPILLETEEDESYFYIVEEYIYGDSLDQYLLYHQNISQDTFLQFAMQLCEIIRYLHTHDPYPILHLDLKPDHIIVCGNQLKLIGISGTAMLLAQITPDWCSLSLILLLLNVPLFLFGLKRQGVQFTIYAVYSVFIYSLGAWLIQGPLPLDVSISSPLAGTDLLLCALFGGLISGVGSGLAIRGGGAMDGMEVMAVIFARKLGMTVGTFVMSYNVVLYILAGLLRSSWILPLYSIIAYAVGLKVVDFVIEGIDRSKAALIVTRNPDAICRALGEAFGTGMTCIPAQGGFSHEEMTIVYFVVNRFQISRMKDIVHDLDDRAYITISEVADVFKLNQDKLSQKVDNQPLLPRRK